MLPKKKLDSLVFLISSCKIPL